MKAESLRGRPWLRLGSASGTSNPVLRHAPGGRFPRRLRLRPGSSRFPLNSGGWRGHRRPTRRGASASRTTRHSTGSLNERKAKWIEDRLPTAGFRCECATLHCGARFRLSPEQWEEARSKPERFVVAPEHVVPDLEVVVKEYPNYWLIEKRGVAGEIAEEMA